MTAQGPAKKARQLVTAQSLSYHRMLPVRQQPQQPCCTARANIKLAAALLSVLDIKAVHMQHTMYKEPALHACKKQQHCFLQAAEQSSKHNYMGPVPAHPSLSAHRAAYACAATIYSADCP